MSEAELKIECMARGLSDEGKRKELQQNLKDHLKGVQRVPALLINEQDKSLEEINLGMEICFQCDLLNDITLMNLRDKT